MELYLINYLRENARTALARECIELLKIELDWFIYNYGDNISLTHRRDKHLSFKERIRDLIVQYNALFNPVKPGGQYILSGFKTDAIKQQMSDNGIQLVSSVLQPANYKSIIGDVATLKMLRKKQNIVRKGQFDDLFNDEFFHQIETCRIKLLETIAKYDFKGLFLYSDQYFESKLLISVCKELKIPTFDFLHGFPDFFSKDVDNSTDYLMVWGERMKQNFVDEGFDENKIVAVGNYKYGNFKLIPNLRNSLDNILVIPCSSVLWHQHTWGEPKLVDRSMIVLYLYQVQNVLERLNVKHARFRPHPSINIDWVYDFLDKNFYYKDTQSLKDSISSSTMVIGATSSVFLETIMYGVNYQVFIPKDGGQNILRTRLVPPFDGSDNKVPVAYNEEDLYQMIKNKEMVDSTILNDYMQPLDLSKVMDLLR